MHLYSSARPHCQHVPGSVLYIIFPPHNVVVFSLTLMNKINFSQPCYPAGTNNFYQAAWHCYNMDSFTLQKPQALINNCMLLLPHHSLWQYNILPTKTSKAKIYMEDLNPSNAESDFFQFLSNSSIFPNVNPVCPLQFLCLLFFV